MPTRTHWPHCLFLFGLVFSWHRSCCRGRHLLFSIHLLNYIHVSLNRLLYGASLSKTSITGRLFFFAFFFCFFWWGELDIERWSSRCALDRPSRAHFARTAGVCAEWTRSSAKISDQNRHRRHITEFHLCVFSNRVSTHSVKIQWTRLATIQYDRVRLVFPSSISIHYPC